METTQKARTTPQDFFLHVFSIIALYVCAGSFLTVLFQIINTYIPDALDYQGYAGETQVRTQMIRSSLATLIIFFPAFALSAWYLQKMYVRIPEKQFIWVRKWLVYFTLFAASLVLLGDLASLVNGVLNGEVRMRFYAKVASVFFVAWSVFCYYIWDIRKVRKIPIAPPISE